MTFKYSEILSSTKIRVTRFSEDHEKKWQTCKCSALHENKLKSELRCHLRSKSCLPAFTIIWQATKGVQKEVGVGFEGMWMCVRVLSLCSPLFASLIRPAVPPYIRSRFVVESCCVCSRQGPSFPGLHVWSTACVRLWMRLRYIHVLYTHTHTQTHTYTHTPPPPQTLSE